MTAEDVKLGKLKTYSEGNKYLEEALISCYENGIETYDCCAGHNNKKLPYFSIIIEKKSLHVIRNIIANLQDMKDISMEYTARFDENNQLLKKGFRGFIIRGALNNRCEMFYRINEAVAHQQPYPQTDLNSEMFYRRLESFFEMNEEEVQSIMEYNRIVGGVFSNNSDEYIEYKKLAKKFLNNPILSKLTQVQTITKEGKKEKERFDKLSKIYNILQEEYVPSFKESLKEKVKGNPIVENNSESDFNQEENSKYRLLNENNTHREKNDDNGEEK